jgi:hypothetical protein
MNESIIASLQKTIDLFAAYEKEIWPDQCEEALSAVRDLQAALAAIRLPTSFVECAELRVGTPAEAERNASRLMQRMVHLEFAREQADHARLALAAYQPHARSKAMRHLQERQRLVGQLRRLGEAAANALQVGDAPLPVMRPDYLQVLPGGSELSEEENHD